MKRRPVIVAGPFASRVDAFRWGMGGPRWHFINRAMLRRYRRGWYVLDRNRAVVHVGSKAWRRRVR